MVLASFLMSTTGTVADVFRGVPKRSLFWAAAVGVLVGVALNWADSQLSSRVGRVEIGIAFAPRDDSTPGEGTLGPTTTIETAPVDVVSTETTVVASTTTSTTTTTLALPSDVDPTWRELLVALTNAERAERGLEPLLSCGNLHVAAQRHAQDMKDQDFFDHTNPFTGDDPSARAIQAGYEAGAGENIAMGYPSPKSVTRGWMNSDGHRENILNGYTHLGIGIVLGGSGDYGDGEWFYWVQKFGNSGNCG